MKFFILCSLMMFNFFLMADLEITEADKKYLEQEEDENGYGCVDWDTIGEGRSIQQADGTWVDQHPQRVCKECCRPFRNGDENDDFVDIIAYCKAVVRSSQSIKKFSCSGVGDTKEEAILEARGICVYKLRQYCRGEEINCKDYQNISRLVSCEQVKVCFAVDYKNGKPYYF